MTSAISKKSDSLPLALQQQQTGSLNGRTVTKQAGEKSQKTLWEKICRWFLEFVHWIQSIFAPAPGLAPLKKEPAPDPITPAAPIDTSFLRPKDPSYNLRRLSDMAAGSEVQSVATQEIFKRVPRKNPIRLGYNDPVDYQTVLGERAIAAQTGLTGLALIGLNGALKASCIHGQNAAEAGRVIPSCNKEAADFWQNTPGKTVLAGAGLLLAASLYAQNKGWLGKLLHDPASGWRLSRLDSLFLAAANELRELLKTDAASAKDMARRIQKNADLIEATLHVDLQIPKKGAAKLVGHLKDACQEVLDPNPLFEKTP